MQLRYYHFSRCSKSRNGLKLLEPFLDQLKVCDYVNEGLTLEVVNQIFKNYSGEISDLVRSDQLKKLNLSIQGLDQPAICKMVSTNPILLQRPLLCSETKTVLGRPESNLLTLFK